MISLEDAVNDLNIPSSEGLKTELFEMAGFDAESPEDWAYRFYWEACFEEKLLHPYH
jgi:hypothetical protein